MKVVVSMHLCRKVNSVKGVGVVQSSFGLSDFWYLNLFVCTLGAL